MDFFAARHKIAMNPLKIIAMLRSSLLLSLALLPLVPSAAGATAPPSALPDAVRDMLSAAIASGNESDIAAVAKVAKATNPAAAGEIDAMVRDNGKQIQQAKEERIRNAGLFDLWTGRGELGFLHSTGSSEEIGVSAGLTLTRQGLDWKHQLRLNADYRRANGETSKEHFLFAYEPRYQVNGRTFTYGLVQYERDPIVGFDDRYTTSAGVGYDTIRNDRMKLSLDAGPSFRHVLYTDDGTENRAGLRSSLDFNWKLSPTLTFQQNASAYVEKENSTVTSLTALDARILARLSARFSYNAAYESKTKLTAESFDTLSKVTLVYNF